MESNQSLAIAELYNMIFSFIKPMCLKCALDLGILHEICNHGQPMTLSQIHSALSIPQSKKTHLHRLMRILTHFGLVNEQVCVSADSEATYDLTLVSRLLTNNEGSINLLPFTLFQLDFLKNFLLKAYLCLGDWFKEKDKETQLPFEMAHNCNFWEMTSQDSKLNGMFNDAMVSTCSIFTDVIIKRGGDIFKEVESLIDVGGGTGTMARTIAMNCPHVQCTVLDLPHVVEGLPNDGIVKFVSGDMFRYIPPADAVLLKWILHCWDDENCIKILKLCKEAISSTEGGKVIIMEAVIGSTSANLSEETKLFFDMLMLTVTTGAERDEQEWKTLFNRAGFSSYKIVHTIGFVSILEVYP